MIDHLAGTWGFCASCERWRCPDTWDTQAGPACPVCASPPALIERRDGDHTVLDLALEVAIGPAGRRRFLED
jgi:hypothetical protein